ncbi:MAG: PQQ-binding-like beta-propeller repeat protein [Verrucomicrobiota bacterium]
MKDLRFWFALALWITLLPLKSADWPAWRGPNGNGVADSDQDPPTSWSAEEHVIWKVKVPGRGHSSPILVGNQVILTTADEKTQAQSVLSFDRDTGELGWETMVHRVPELPKIHKKNTHASPTAASNGSSVFVVFFNDGILHLTSLNLKGEKQWQKQAGSFRPRYHFGYAASPLLYGDSVIVSAEFADGGYLAAFSSETGLGIWRTPRDKATSYSSPIVGNVAGRDQLLISGGEKISSYDPANGQLVWQVDGGTSATAGTMIWTPTQVYASGGFPTKETIAVVADGSRRIAWKNQEKCYEQSLLAYDGHLYAINDGGIAMCWKASDGRELWKERLGGPVSASPVLVGDRIYATNERGQTFVFRASPTKFELLATNQLGDESFATPAVCDSRVYHRVATYEGENRQEWLYCLGRKP